MIGARELTRICGLAAVAGLVACGGAPRQLATPAPAPERDVPVVVAATPPTPPAPLVSAEAAVAADDSAADEAALAALQELEFRSLGKGAEHVRGIVSAPVVASWFPDPATSRGGALSGPTYDIDVESFIDHERVQYYIDFFLGPSRDRFTIWLGRLHRYESMIRDGFRELGVPEDMVYLGLIESGYSPTAVSRANAVGMWQFIRSTGRLYGLTIDDWVDDRRDPFKATDAAGRYLADLNNMFGSWYLAAAAYNGGEGRVSRSIRRLYGHTDYMTDTTFFHLSERRYLRRETRDYVPKLIAAALIAKDPLRYGFDSIPYLEPLEFDEVSVPDQTGLDVIARLADEAARTIMELNPRYIRGVTPPGRISTVRVPRGAGPRVERRYAELPIDERVNFLEHVVRRGETLSQIGRRYRVSVSLLRAANGNVHPQRLRVGQRLVIPVSGAARSLAAAGDAPAPTRGVPGVRYHLVRSGDTLWRVSQRYRVSISDLRRWNEIWGHSTLRVGQRLKVAP